jgi:GTP pyrophosphokinase
MDDLLTYRAKCCNPIRGEPIVGYVTRGKGIAVHSATCSNVQNLMYEVERKIEVEWARAVQETFQVKLLVRSEDRPGMLSQITTALFNEQTNIHTLETRPGDGPSNEGALVVMTLEVKDKRQLERVISAIRRVSGIRDIERVHEG